MGVSRKKFSLEDIIAAYEKRQLGIINEVVRQIMELMDAKSSQLAFLYTRRKLINNRFLPKDIRDTIERVTTALNTESRDIIINGIKRSWALSDEKNNVIETKVAGSGRRPPPGKKLKVAPGSGGKPKGVITAVDEYIKRKTKGLGLSKRIWKLSPAFKKVVNDQLLDSLKNGTPARTIAAEMRKSLRNNLMTQTPGKGIYKSPQKNAMRVARSEINLAYANADFQRWQTMWFVIGIQVNLSNRHPKYDICDAMVGKYPKTFHFVRWHPNCLCIAVPVLADQKTRDEMMDYQLGLRPEPPKVDYVTAMPPAAVAWFKKNSSRVKGWKNQPYWLSANQSHVGKFFA